MLKDLPCQLVENETYKLLDMDEDLLIDTPTSKGEIRNPDDDGLLVEMPEVEVNENDPNIIKVIGVGGGGGNAVANMYQSNIEGVRFLVCNSDSKALHDSPSSHRVQLGPGLGAGGKPEFGRKLAEENIEAIRGMFDDQTKMVFISAGMGGGTGTGAAPIIARESMKRGILTIGIVTIPFLFEMRKRIDLALDEIDGREGQVGRDELVVVGAAVLRASEGELHVGTQHLVHADDVGPLHALLLLKGALGIGGLRNLFTDDGLTTALLESEVAG